MRYAIVENNIVKNIISLDLKNAKDFPSAVSIGDIPVFMGDTYENGRFYRDGALVLTSTEQRIADLEKELAAAKILLGVE